MRPLMIWGTSGRVGKTVLTMSICRLLLQRGFRVIPFKGIAVSKEITTFPNGVMASGMVEIAEACRLDADPRMNPILLYPHEPTINCDVFARNYKVDLYICGRSQGVTTIAELNGRIGELLELIRTEYKRLAPQGDVVIIEGAGNPAEGGPLSALANRALADLTNSACLLVTDCQNGAPISGALGTVSLLREAGTLDRVIGLILNRGAGPMLDCEALDLWTVQTGLPIIGDSCYAPQDSPIQHAMEKALGMTPAPSHLRHDHWYELLSQVVGSSLDLDYIVQHVTQLQTLAKATEERA